MASLGFDKSYRETVVLMTRSYLNKLSNVGSAESKTEAAEATTERVEVCNVSKNFNNTLDLVCLVYTNKWILTS